MTQLDSHHDDATTWRDLAHQLTPFQVAKLTALEGRQVITPQAEAETLIECAREWAAGNLADQVIFGHLAPPPDAQRFFMWADDEDEDGWARIFDGTRRDTDGASVFISGFQWQDGRIERAISIAAAGDFDAAAARRVAASLLEAADEIEKLQ